MKAKTVLTLTVLIIVFAAIFFMVDLQVAHAQSECTDAAGAPIDCPPTDDGTGDDTGSGTGGNDDDPRPTKTPVPLPRATYTPTPTLPAIDMTPMDEVSSGEPSLTQTATPFVPSATPASISDAPDNGDLDDIEWDTTCTGTTKQVVHCIGVFTNACEHVGGSTSETIKGNDVTMKCTVPSANAQPAPSQQDETQPDTGDTDGDVTCYSWMCTMDAYVACWWAGGDYSESANGDGSITSSCGLDDTNQSSIPYPGLPLLLLLVLFAAIGVPTFVQMQLRAKVGGAPLPPPPPPPPPPSNNLPPAPQIREHILLSKSEKSSTKLVESVCKGRVSPKALEALEIELRNTPESDLLPAVQRVREAAARFSNTPLEDALRQQVAPAQRDHISKELHRVIERMPEETKLDLIDAPNDNASGAGRDIIVSRDDKDKD